MPGVDVRCGASKVWMRLTIGDMLAEAKRGRMLGETPNVDQLLGDTEAMHGRGWKLTSRAGDGQGSVQLLKGSLPCLEREE